jgi:glutaconate CoA-transferase subunit A
VTATTTALDAVGELFSDGMTIGIGGWGSRRKPMALVRELVRSGAKDLTIVSFGGPDVGTLCATGQAARVVFGFVTLDTIAIDPHFARARQAGTVTALELDEGMLVSGLRAAGRRLPFEVTRSGLGSDALAEADWIRTITSPYDDAEELVAMPAIPLDLALVHLNAASERGDAQSLGPDPYFDDLFALAASRTVLSVERLADGGPEAGILNSTMVDHVVVAPRGAGFTSCLPDYERDEAAQREYADAAASPEAWRAYRERHLDGAGND